MIRPRIDRQRHYERPHVLIISDDPSLVTFLSEGLPLGGFWTSVIASGLQALEVFRLRQFDLIAIDATLQSFDALELMRRLRGKSQRAKGSPARTTAPFVAFGSLPTAVDQDIDAELGIVARFEPPVELEDIVPALHEAFARWRSDHPDTPLADTAALRDF
jgi:CheY-like chemotaxis protein